MAATKNKPHKGLLKRVRITKSGFVKHKSANSKHLKSGKSRIASNAEMEQLELMLHRRVRGRDQPRTARRRSPSPQERHAAEAHAKETK
jgi:ribosomal protein L35